jgi:ABC-type sugar transport system ATPase subunit
MAKAATVSAADRGLLTIGIALDDGSDARGDAGKILILDEATAAIREKEAFAVLRRVRQLADNGLAVLMVTHRISEAIEFADRMTVIYDGDTVYQDTAKLHPDRIIELIVTGRVGVEAKSEILPGGRSPAAEKRAVQVEGLSGPGLNNVSFHINAGEILGIVGGPQSGAEEIAAALAGLTPEASGSVTIDGALAPLPRRPQEAIRRGICLVPRDRLRQGGIGTLSVFENVLLPNARGLLYGTGRHRALVEAVIREFTVSPTDSHLRFRELSGGNQQKVIVGKWLGRRPKLMILDDPTIGVDPGARRTMFEVVAERCRAEGLAVLLLSSEPEELVRHCSRLLAVEDGRIVDELAGDRVDQLAVSSWASK